MSRGDEFQSICRHSLDCEAEAIAKVPRCFELAPDQPDLHNVNGIAATCPICPCRILIKHTKSVHYWGFMVQGYCGHIFPAAFK